MAAEDESWKDTNVGAIGSDEDKAVRKAAASHEPAWENCGQAAGIEIWRIEHFQVVAVDKDTHGQFHKGDSYIVLQTVETDSKLDRHIFFYLGSETSIDEQGTAAYKTVELDDFFDGEPVQHREVMGEETAEFKDLFPDGITVLDGGVDSGFKHVVPEGHDTKMYHVRRVKGKDTTVRVPLQTRVLNPGDCFVLDAPNAVYVLDGPNAEPREKMNANMQGERIESEREGRAQCTHDIDDDFWGLLEGDKPAWWSS